MADLPELNEWPEGIYQFETSDPVLGGPEGIDNLQAKQLASRTKWLRAQLKEIFDGVASVGKATQLTTARALKFKGAATGTGDFDGSAATEITLTLANSGVEAGSYPKVTVNSKGLVTGGTALTAGDLPEETTAPQFDNDKSRATTEFVQRALGSFSGGRSENKTGLTLPLSDIGKLVSLYLGAAQTVALPLLQSVPEGATFTLHNPTGFEKVITVNGPDKISPDGNAYTVITLKQGDTVSVTKESFVWRLHGVGALKYSSQFAASTGEIGFEKSPSGLIEQWGTGVSDSKGDIYVTFPASFTSSMHNVVGNHLGGDIASVICVAGTATKQGVTLRVKNSSGNTSAGWNIFWRAIGV
ncbi:hypothetical protein HZF02_16120 [Pseudomonas yamanorum]|nr:hypothetical protein HZF02_16120 [Pseudomonas yamanorum]